MGERLQHRVEILPVGLTIMVPDGESIMLTALANGWKWPNVCGGEAACGVCVLEIQQGLENASPIGRDEIVRLTFIRKADKPGVRLCLSTSRFRSDARSQAGCAFVDGAGSPGRTGPRMTAHQGQAGASLALSGHRDVAVLLKWEHTYGEQSGIHADDA